MYCSLSKWLFASRLVVPLHIVVAVDFCNRDNKYEFKMPFIVFKPINLAFKVCYPSIFHLCPSAIKKAPKVKFLDWKFGQLLELKNSLLPHPPWLFWSYSNMYVQNVTLYLPWPLYSPPWPVMKFPTVQHFLNITMFLANCWSPWEISCKGKAWT